VGHAGRFPEFSLVEFSSVREMANVQATMDTCSLIGRFVQKIMLEKLWSAPTDFAYVDETRIRRFFARVLNSAVKFTPDRGRIVVSTNSSSQDCDLMIGIVDTGVGMTQENLNRILGPFSPFDGEDEIPFYRQNGFGLSMPIERSLIQIQKGSFQG
jgi:signal transduction histidine kinase